MFDLNAIFLPFSNVPMGVDFTKYLYVTRQINEVINIATKNFISAGTASNLNK